MQSPTTAAEALGRHRDALERALRAAVGAGATPLVATARYVMGWEDTAGRPAANGGKRIRPALCLLASEAVGGTAAMAMPAAVAVELVHNFSLVHDEVQDHDAERHHRPTAWALLGEGQAINVGNFLYMRAIQALAVAAGAPGPRMQALTVLNTAIGEMLEGQWQDLAFEQRDGVSVADYLLMVAGKTGALLGAPLEMGALLGGADGATAALLGRWGRRVGLAFQAQDDYLGIWGDPDHTGKSNTNDIARRKKTLPVIHGLGHPASAEAIRGVYAKSAVTPADVALVTEALGRAGADDVTRQYAAQFADEADMLLDEALLTAAARAALRDIARYMVDRAG